MNLQEVLRYTEPCVRGSWKRMTLYRATDAADTMDMAALLIAAYLEATGGNVPDIRQHLQPSQQHARADGPGPSARATAAGLLNHPLTEQDTEDQNLQQVQHSLAQRHNEAARTGHEDPWHLWTQACLHGLRARTSDDLDSLDHFLPPHIAQMARKVAQALTDPNSPTRSTATMEHRSCRDRRGRSTHGIKPASSTAATATPPATSPLLSPPSRPAPPWRGPMPPPAAFADRTGRCAPRRRPAGGCPWDC